MAGTEISERVGTTSSSPKTRATNSRFSVHSDQTPLEILPGTCEFKNVEANVTYVLPIIIRNASNDMRRLRFIKPKTNVFQLKYDIVGLIAPGLSISAELIFLCDSLKDYHDSFTVMTEDYKAVIPIDAYAPGSDIQFDPVVKFGVVNVGRAFSKHVEFTNKGTREGTVRISNDVLDVDCQPRAFTLPPNGFQTVRVEYKAREPGQLRAILPVEIVDKGIEHLDISGTAMDQVLDFVLTGTSARASRIDFGSLYHGQQREVSGVIVNNGPKACSFNIRFLANSDEESDDTFGIATPADAGKQQTQQVMSAAPFSGMLQPYSEIKVLFKCRVPKQEDQRGWKKNFDPTKFVSEHQFVALIESEELNQKLHVELSAKAYKPAIDLSGSALNFGDCAVNDRRDIVVTISNLHEPLSIDYSINKVAHFYCNPAAATLQPLQKQDVVFTFEPKQLGKFHNTMTVSLCNGLYSQSIQVTGFASAEGPKRKRVGGPDKTVADFRPTHHFLRADEMEKPPARRRKDRNETQWWEERDMSLTQETSAYALTMEASHMVKAHKDKYNSFIQEMRATRLANSANGSNGKSGKHKLNLKDIDIFYKEDPDIGLDPASGLESPKLELPRQVDPLWLAKPSDDLVSSDSSKIDSARPRAVVHDEIRLVRKKFKAHPTTQAELRECSQSLDASQLMRISAGPKVLNFGQLFVKSVAVRNFSLVNDLNQNILVTLSMDADELHKSTPLSQVIPPGALAGFDITFSSKTLQNFRKTVSYCINGVHNFKFLVAAVVVPVFLSLSRTEIPFHFTDDNLERTVTEQVTGTNAGNAPARFRWRTVGSSFTADPESDVIPAGKSATVNITFAPANGTVKSEEILTLKVEDGEDRSVRCVGHVPETKCAFIERKLDLGVVAVGVPKEQTVTLKNTGKNTAVFYVEPTIAGITVTPMKGRLVPDSRTELIVSVHSAMPQTFDTILTLNVRGGKSIKLPIAAESIVPQVTIKEDEFDFGGVTIGDALFKRITLVNDSIIPATLLLDLTEHPEFTIRMPPEREDDLDSILVPLSAAGNSFSPVDDMGEEPVDSRDEEDNNADRRDSTRRFHIKVTPKTTLALQLHFAPTEVEGYMFDLPIALTGVGSSPGLRRLVAGEGLKPRLLLSSSTIDFKSRVVTSSIKSVPALIELQITSTDTQRLSWSIDSSTIQGMFKNFVIEPTQGTLENGETRNVRITFRPTEAKDYLAVVPLYLDGQRDRSYLNLTLKGTGHVPSLTFDRREVVLPVVPLGVKTRALFYVINEGFENLELNFKLPADSNRIPLTLHFPEGTNIGVTKPRLPVEVSFMSKKSMSFTAKVDFLDQDGNRFTVNVSGTTDNSILTCQSYLTKFPDFYDLECENGKPIMLIEKKETAMNGHQSVLGMPRLNTAGTAFGLDNDSQSLAGGFSPAGMGYGGGVAKTPRSVGYTPGGQPAGDVTLDYLVRWLNSSVLKSSVQSFPADFISSQGRHLYEMVELLSGKQIPGKCKSTPSSSPSFNRREHVQHLVQQYEEMLNFLKSHGALLNTVRPEHFLSVDDYIRVMQSSPFVHNQRRTYFERKFHHFSYEAWSTCVYQIVKIFLLNRIQPKQFKTVPGLPADLNIADPTFSGSNIYSVSESVLLKWLSYHHERMNPQAAKKRVTNFDTDLRDGLVLASLIQSHVSSVPALMGLRWECLSDEHCLSNANKVIGALNEIGVHVYVQPRDIVEGNARDMLLLVMHLYQNLPHYIPKTVVEFTTSLGETCSKNIELTNPSNKPINYWVKLEGSKDFRILKEEIRLEPKSSESFTIEYTSRFSKAQEGRIFFISRREGAVQAAAIVFTLKSNVTARSSIKSWQIDTRLYEPVSIELEIASPFTQDAELSTSIQWERLGPLPGDRTKPSKAVAQSQLVDHKTTNFAANNAANTMAESIGIEPFFCRVERLKLKKEQITRVPVTFLPFEPGRYRCFLIFLDEQVGEFQHEVLATADLPLSTDKLAWSCTLGQTIAKDVAIPYKNPQLERARATVTERNKKGRELTKVPPVTLPDQIIYDVEYSSPFFVGPKQVTLQDVKMPKQPANGQNKQGQLTLSSALASMNQDNQSGSQSDSNKIIIQFTPKEGGVYPCRVVLRSAFDVRLYEFECIGSTPPAKASLEFCAPARQAVTQEIPIVNKSDKDWQIRALFKQAGQDFTGPRELVVKRMSTGTYPLTFKPFWICDTTAQLVLTNSAIEQAYEYDLRGIGEEPLSEDHVILECKARTKNTFKFNVANPYKQTMTYTVESDLQNISGDSSFVVPAESTHQYELSIQPLQGGSYTGSITFLPSNGHFVWYTVEVRAGRPTAEATLELTATVRKAVAVEIRLANPLDELVEFEVAMQGDALLGEPVFMLAPRETNTYELIYSPLLPGVRSGSISFAHELLGEFWYELVLTAENAAPEQLPLLTCELGKTASHQVEVENPSSDQIMFKSMVSNSLNFRLNPQKVLVQPFQSAIVTVEYTPSSLQDEEECDIVLEHPVAGRWSYHVRGKGSAPTQFESMLLTTGIAQTTTSLVPFRNPFREAIVVAVSLETGERNGIFSLLTKKPKFQIAPLATLQIPFSFSPQMMSQHAATVVVQMVTESNRTPLVWRYPIIGMAEFAGSDISFSFTTKARASLQQRIKLSLPGVSSLDGPEQFKHYFITAPESRVLVDRSLSFEPLTNIITPGQQPIEFDVIFEPLRPFRVTTELVIEKLSGGRWRFDVTLESTEPEIDDVIHMEAALNRTSSVSFKLTNQFSTYAEFQAYFSADSPYEFSVYPTEGVLEPFGGQGSNFIVSFTPTEYGKTRVGKLLIVTEEMQWTYEVRGTHPHYVKPHVTESKINNRLRGDVEEMLTAQPKQRNFLKENMKARKPSPPKQPAVPKSNMIQTGKFGQSSSRRL